MVQVFRWLLITPACVAAWYLALFIGLYIHSIVASFCPPEFIVSGFCEAPWYPTAEKIVMCSGAALSAFLVVLTAAAVAPSHRVLASKIALAIGAVVAIIFAVAGGAYFALASALLAGLLGVLVATALVRRGHQIKCHVA